MTGIARRGGRILPGIALALFLAVLLCGVLQAQGLFAPADRAAMEAVGRLRDTGTGQMFTPAAILLSAMTGTSGRFVMLALIAPVLLMAGRGRQWVWLAGVTVAAMLLNTGLKLFFQAARPALISHLDPIATYSFPSGHASGNMAFLGTLAILSGRRSGFLAAAGLIFAIGVSRVWLGVHWPSDVMCGWMEGVAILLLAWRWLPRRRPQKK